MELVFIIGIATILLVALVGGISAYRACKKARDYMEREGRR